MTDEPNSGVAEMAGAEIQYAMLPWVTRNVLLSGIERATRHPAVPPAVKSETSGTAAELMEIYPVASPGMFTSNPNWAGAPPVPRGSGPVASPPLASGSMFPG